MPNPTPEQTARADQFLNVYHAALASPEAVDFRELVAAYGADEAARAVAEDIGAFCFHCANGVAPILFSNGPVLRNWLWKHELEGMDFRCLASQIYARLEPDQRAAVAALLQKEDE